MAKIRVSKLVYSICDDFVSGLKDILSEKLYGVYIYGASAFPDKLPSGDIDFHVILKSGLSEKERSRLEKLHNLLAEKHPPLGGELDGYYILLKDARRTAPPKSQMWKRATDDSWALHREHILAGRCLVLFGPEPENIYKPASWSEIKRALYSELDFIEKHLTAYPDYCILNLCRLLYSFETKDIVISKDQASKWGLKNLSRWKRHIELARKSYSHQATLKDRQFMLSEVKMFLEFSKKMIEKHAKSKKKHIAQHGSYRM